MTEWNFVIQKRNTASSDLPLFYRAENGSYSRGESIRITLATLAKFHM